MKRLVLVAICMCAIPLFTHLQSPSGGLALAGHTVQGLYCEDCGAQGCICDSGEVPQRSTVSNTDDTRLLEHDATPSEAKGDLGPGLLVAMLGLLLWMRMRT